MVIMADSHYRIDFVRGSQLQNILNNSTVVQTFDETTKFNSKIYPYTNMQATKEATKIEILEWVK
jgi:hypothetical protein